MTSQGADFERDEPRGACVAMLLLEAHCSAAGATGLVVALSGGADSVTGLLRAIGALGTGFRGLPTRAVRTVDHGPSSAAPEFRAACGRVCADLGVPLTVIEVEVDDSPSGVSIEAAAGTSAVPSALAAELRSGECLLTAHRDRRPVPRPLLLAGDAREPSSRACLAMPGLPSAGQGLARASGARRVAGGAAPRAARGGRRIRPRIR